jgi:hypothetical protein
MPEIRTHLDSVVAAKNRYAGSETSLGTGGP